MTTTHNSPRRPRTVFRRLDGILLLDKPQGLSSNQALQRVRHLFRAEKGGHTGSLDPLATGLLPVCFGEATKIAGGLLGARKAYETVAHLGVVTDTDDAEGQVLRERPVPALTIDQIDAALRALTGRIQQRPPIFSALKRGGEPLYLKARRGEVIEVEPRDVDVHDFNLLNADDLLDGGAPTLPMCAVLCVIWGKSWVAVRMWQNCGACGWIRFVNPKCGRLKHLRIYGNVQANTCWMHVCFQLKQA